MVGRAGARRKIVDGHPPLSPAAVRSHRQFLYCMAWRAGLAVLASVPAPAAAQPRTLTACTPDGLAVCSELRLTTAPSVFEIALRTIGSTAQPTLPVSVYNLVLATR